MSVECYEHDNNFILDQIIIKGNQDLRKISDEFKLWPHMSIYCVVTCPELFFLGATCLKLLEKKPFGMLALR